jgi:chromate transporter
LLVVLVIAALFASVADMPMAQGALKGMGAVSAGLIAAVGLRLAAALKVNVMSVGVCIAFAAITFIAITIFRMPLVWVLLGLGSVATCWAYRQLGVIEQAAATSKGGQL